MSNTIRLRAVVDEDFLNYKEPAMFLITCFCDFKCCHEAGIPESVCQNEPMIEGTSIMELDNDYIIKHYLDNDITKAIVFGGLEPILQFPEVREFIRDFRKVSNDPVIIYTGYNKDEILPEIDELKKLGNIIVKFGRFVPNDQPHIDDVLGITLCSLNQYGERI